VANGNATTMNSATEMTKKTSTGSFTRWTSERCV
jgi:hypothetical protein